MPLKGLLSEQVTYGHSNGWIETKKDVIADLFSGKLTYKKITSENITVASSGTTATARMAASVEIDMSGTPLALKLKVLQVWIWRKNHWELLARQSVKTG